MALPQPPRSRLDLSARYRLTGARAGQVLVNARRSARRRAARQTSAQPCKCCMAALPRGGIVHLQHGDMSQPNPAARPPPDCPATERDNDRNRPSDPQPWPWPARPLRRNDRRGPRRPRPPRPVPAHLRRAEQPVRPRPGRPRHQPRPDRRHRPRSRVLAQESETPPVSARRPLRRRDGSGPCGARRRPERPPSGSARWSAPARCR